LFGIIQIKDPEGKGCVLPITTSTYRRSLELVGQFLEKMANWPADPFSEVPDWAKPGLLDGSCVANLLLVDGDLYHATMEIAGRDKKFDPSEFLSRKCIVCLELTEFVREHVVENYYPDEKPAAKKGKK
jgi:hypothetical protein